MRTLLLMASFLLVCTIPSLSLGGAVVYQADTQSWRRFLWFLKES